jgi:hypothetical protein
VHRQLDGGRPVVRPIGPDALVAVTPGAQVRGGHEMCVTELLMQEPGNLQRTDRVRIPQSWGPGFGANGWIEMEIATLDRLLADDGDATIPIP